MHYRPSNSWKTLSIQNLIDINRMQYITTETILSEKLKKILMTLKNSIDLEKEENDHKQI